MPQPLHVARAVGVPGRAETLADALPQEIVLVGVIEVPGPFHHLLLQRQEAVIECETRNDRSGHQVRTAHSLRRSWAFFPRTVIASCSSAKRILSRESR